MDVTTGVRAPEFEPDPSVAAWLKDHQNFAAALNYRYATADVVPAAPFQVASDDQYVFLFRQSPTNSIMSTASCLT